MNAEPKRRGRPKNSKSFTALTLAELNQRFKPDDSIMVGRIFLEKGVIGAKPQNPFLPSNNEIKSATSSAMVEMTLQP